MPRKVVVAATQFAVKPLDPAANLDKAEKLIRDAAAAGANIILVQELFENIYFCQEQKPDYFQWAHPVEESPAVQRFTSLAKELHVVLPVSFFEKGNNAHFNSLAVIDADGTLLDLYRKSHIPDGPGYEEKFYFSPGDTGFKVFNTKYGKLGAAICWDQWFPETARALALQGAEILMFPSAIGTEPTNPSYNSYPHWARTMLGHAAANLCPLVACNRVGTEKMETGDITFYGSSFIAGPHGEVVAQVGAHNNEFGNIDPKPDKKDGFVVAEFDLDAVYLERVGWGVFRDRRPELYKPLVTLDGIHTHKANA